MLLGSDLPEVNIPGLTAGFQGGYSQAGGLAAGYAGNSAYGGFDGAATGGTAKGSRPFLDMNGQSPRNPQGGPTSIRAHLNHSQKAVLGDDAI